MEVFLRTITPWAVKKSIRVILTHHGLNPQPKTRAERRKVDFNFFAAPILVQGEAT